MGVFEDFWEFDPDGRQLVDIEKTPIVDFLRCYFPECWPVRLGVDQCIQLVKTVWLSGNAVKRLNSFFDGRPYTRTGAVQSGNSLLDDLLFTEPFFNPFRRYLGTRRQLTERS